MSSPGSMRRFYSTDLSPCPYLPERAERRLVAVVAPEGDDDQLSLLSEAGFRRSQSFLYKPICPGCRACIPVRIVVDAFRPARGFRKVLSRNADLMATERPARATHEQFELFHRYLLSRHAEGGMSRMSWEAYRDMIELGPESSRVLEFRDEAGRLVGASLTDHLRSGLSGVYKFFEPEDERRSLGTFIILAHIVHAQRLGLPYVYLGYWIADCRKMAYKARFSPLQQLVGAAWLPLELGPQEEERG